MQRLWCEIGEHHWDREPKRGRKPRGCPEHLPQPESRAKLSTAEANRRREAGRQKATKLRRKESVKKVLAYKKWLRLDSPLWRDYQRGFISRDQWLKEKPKVPVIPGDSDYEAARLEGAIA